MIEGFHIGEIPKNWQMMPFGSCCKKISDNYKPSGSGTIPYLGLEHLASGFPSLIGKGVENEVKSTKSFFEPGDILFGKLRPYLRKAILSDFRGICSTDILVFRVQKNVIAEYLIYLIHSDPFIEHAKRTTSGVQHPRTSWRVLKDFFVPLPPLHEQRKIAHVLSTVQRAIEQQERIIALTTELKKALMHKLFTEGLHGEPQKETEIGLVPESWDVCTLGDCAVVQTGIAKGRKVDNEEALTLPYLRVANVQDGFLDLSEIKVITIRKKEKERYLLREGDVVLTEGGDFDKLGRGFIWHGQIQDCIHQNHIFAVRVDRERLIPEFFAYQSQSPYGKTYFLSVAHKTTNLACINTTKLKGFPVLIPKLEEQRGIVNMLQSIDQKAANHQQRKIVLQDLFHTLLHQLMTAQIRVHELEFEVLHQLATDVPEERQMGFGF